MEYTVSGANILVLAIFVWYLGTYLNRKIAVLDHYSIPVAVTGGLLCSIAMTFLYYAFDVTVNFDTRLRDLLLLTFFSTYRAVGQDRAARRKAAARFCCCSRPRSCC